MERGVYTVGVGLGGGMGSGRMQGRERLIYFLRADEIVLPRYWAI